MAMTAKDMHDRLTEWMREGGAPDWADARIELVFSTPGGTQSCQVESMSRAVDTDEDDNEAVIIRIYAEPAYPLAMSVEDARGRLGDLVTRAAAGGQITTIVKNGIPGAALVPLSLLPQAGVEM
jgi:prevent-host-death family protein